MAGWEWESFEDLVNNGLFTIADPGPLHAPIRTFSLRRNAKLRLELETKAEAGAKSTAVSPPSGTVRLNTETVSLEGIGGATAVLHGVQTLNVVDSSNYATGHNEVTESAQFHRIEGEIPGAGEAKYTIDWLENVDGSAFLWPDSIDRVETTSIDIKLGAEGEGITLHDRDEARGFGWHCARLTVAGCTLYLCPAWKGGKGLVSRPGCIIYAGTPDAELRKRIRDVLSFGLGMYLVYLGSATFSEEWATVSFSAVSGYSIDGRVLEQYPMPPAPLGVTYQNELSTVRLGRVATALMQSYDDLNFGELSWAYWHAICAPVHIAAVHFGASLEALQRRYIEARPKEFSAKIVTDKDVWKQIRRAIDESLSKAKLSEEERQLLSKNFEFQNRLPQPVVMDRLLGALRLNLGVREQQAWARRNQAAHGKDIEEGSEVALIYDIKLLRVLFNRLILRMTSASDDYVDYASLNFPSRKLSEPVPASP